MTIAALNNVSKRFGSTLAVHDASFTIEAGELVGLLGPNGAGKTTTLTMLQGLRAPTDGTVTLFGGSPRDARNRARLGSTPQQTGLPEALNVREALRFAAAHFPHATAIDAVIDRFGLAPLLTKQCGSLSGGQQRRVAVALAFIGQPQLVLLDEPTTGLDVDARRELWTAIREAHAEGCAVVITSHHLEEIEALAERVIVFDRGTVLVDDTLERVVGQIELRRLTLAGVSAHELDALPGVESVETRADGSHTILTRDGDALVRTLVERGLPFTDLTVRGASLEEAFLAITKGAA